MKDKVVLVTGAASGIGKAVALRFAAEGAKLVLSDIQEQQGTDLANNLKQQGVDAVFVKANVGDREEVKNLIAKAVEIFGRIDFGVNNAGIGGKMAVLHEIEDEDWDKMMAINLSGVFYCMKEELKVMIEQGSGGIVNISSVAGLGGMIKGSAYSAAKHGVIGLTKSAAVEYGRLGIRINAICPGYTKTAILDDIEDEFLNKSVRVFVPMRRLGKAGEVADAVYWLFSDQSSFVNGHSLAVDGGFKAS